MLSLTICLADDTASPAALYGTTHFFSHCNPQPVMLASGLAQVDDNIRRCDLFPTLVQLQEVPVLIENHRFFHGLYSNFFRFSAGQNRLPGCLFGKSKSVPRHHAAPAADPLTCTLAVSVSFPQSAQRRIQDTLLEKTKDHKPMALWSDFDQWLSLALPLALLRAKTFLPFAVAILLRKPCTFFR